MSDTPTWPPPRPASEPPEVLEGKTSSREVLLRTENGFWFARYIYRSVFVPAPGWYVNTHRKEGLVEVLGTPIEWWDLPLVTKEEKQ